MGEHAAPTGATHYAEFYGRTQFYKRVTYDRVSEYTDGTLTVVEWYWWDNRQWTSQLGKGFSPRLVKPVCNLV